MRTVAALRSLRSIKASLKKPEDEIPRFINIALSPNTQTMLAKRAGWTFVW
jgi:hypothetical protein